MVLSVREPDLDSESGARVLWRRGTEAGTHEKMLLSRRDRLYFNSKTLFSMALDCSAMSEQRSFESRRKLMSFCSYDVSDTSNNLLGS